MKNIKYTISLLLTMAFMSMALNAQNWQPFPARQVTYWQLAPDSIDLYYCDTTFMNNGQLYQVNGANYYFKDYLPTCADAMYSYLHALSSLVAHYPLAAPPAPDTFTVSQGVANFSVNGATIPFYLNATLGQAWGVAIPSATVDSLHFVCTAIHEETFVGFTDSVRVYTAQAFLNGQALPSLNNLTYKLSKQAGFIAYLPFDRIAEAINAQTWTIYGFYTESLGKHGFVNAKSDYEPPCISIGDFEIRRTVYRNSDNMRRDYVTNIVVHGDTTWVTYHYDSYGTAVNGQVTYLGNSGDMTIMTIKQLQDKPVTAWVRPQNAVGFISLERQSYYFENNVLFNNSLREAADTEYNPFYPNCLEQSFDMSIAYTNGATRKVGVSANYSNFINSNPPYFESRLLIGTKHCGQVTGNTSFAIPIGVSVVSNNSAPINIYPNPTNSALNVIGDFESVEVHSLTGQLLLQSNDKVLHLDELPAGLYLLLVKKNNQLIYTDKVVKL